MFISLPAARALATGTVGTKSRCCSAVAMTWRCCEQCLHAPSERPPASSKNPPSANARPPHRRRASRRCFGAFSTPRPKAGWSCRSLAIASFRSKIRSSFIGQILEHAIGCDTVVALAQHGKQIRDDEQGGGGPEQESPDYRARQRRILLLAGAADRHRQHAYDHRGCRHQHGADTGMTCVKGGTERASPIELLFTRERDQENGIRRCDADRHDRAHQRGDAERRAGDEQHRDDAAQGCRQRQDYYEGVAEILVVEDHEQIDEYGRKQQSDAQIAKGIANALDLTRTLARVVGLGFWSWATILSMSPEMLPRSRPCTLA